MTEPIFPTSQPQDTHPAASIAAASLPDAASQRYKIRQEIGRGFSSIVYEALDTLRGRPVALKVLTLGPTLSAERQRDMAERFLREARAISALSHPNIVSIYEVGQAGDGRQFIAMELLTGESLRARMDREAPLGPEKAVPVALQVANALEYAHGRGIVHRDVKPDNIFVLPDGRVKLMDFGVAHIVSEGALTQTGTVVGSPAYMSPEQIGGLPLTGSSDVFSLGITLAEMLTGQKPFDAPSIPAVMNRILHRPAQIDGVQPRALRRVLAQSLAKNQSARYPTAQAFAEALRRAKMTTLPLDKPAGEESSATTIMAAPQTRPAVVSGLSAVRPERAQEPPTRAALWTFGAAGLAILAIAPFALRHLPSDAPLRADTAVRSVPPSTRGADTPSPEIRVAHIPATWHRQTSALHAAHPSQKSTVAAVPAIRHPLTLAPATVGSVAIAPVSAHPLALAAKHPVMAQKTAAVSPAPPATPRAVSVASAAAPLKTHALPKPKTPQVLAQAAWHGPNTRVASALPASPAFRPSAPRPAVVRVSASQQEQRLSSPNPQPVQVPDTPVLRPVVIPDSAPRVLRRAAAAYPEALRAGGIGGTVLVRLSVDAQGRVTEATVIQSSGTDDLDAAALDSVGHWFYEPAYQGGRAVPAQVTARIDFHP